MNFISELYLIILPIFSFHLVLSIGFHDHILDTSISNPLSINLVKAGGVKETKKYKHSYQQ